MDDTLICENNNSYEKQQNFKIMTEKTESFLFDPACLKSINFESCKNRFKIDVKSSLDEPGNSIRVKPLSLSDYDKGFLELLAQLTAVDEVSREDFEKRFWSMKNCSNSYYVVVLEDLNLARIAGTATLVVEQKFIHGTGSRGRIEDVVVNDEYRGKQLGKLLVAVLTLLGEQLGCYKMSLECKDRLVPFYETFGFKVDVGNNFLVQRFGK